MTVSCLGMFKPKGTKWKCSLIWQSGAIYRWHANDFQPREMRSRRSSPTSYIMVRSVQLSTSVSTLALSYSLLNWVGVVANIDKAVAKARKVWHRTTRGANVLAKLQIYKSLVVPVLKYASPLAIESPHQERYSKPQVIVQRHVTKVALGYWYRLWDSTACIGIGVSIGT